MHVCRSDGKRCSSDMARKEEVERNGAVIPLVKGSRSVGELWGSSRWHPCPASHCWLKCCFTPIEAVGLLGTGAQDVHLDLHTAPEL